MAASAYPVVAQDGPEEIIELLLTEGAEILITNIDENGAPAVIYAQLGSPVEALDLEAEMYDNCLALAVIATRGELLDYIFSMIGEDFMGGGESSFMLSQFDEGFTPEAILDLLGSDFRLLISAYNLDEAVVIGKMGQVLANLANPAVFGFSFADIIHLRIDEDFFGEGFDITLPFESLDVFMYQVTNPFADALNAVLGGLDDSGILSNIDAEIFLAERGAAAGLLAIPDIGDLVELFNDTMGGGGFSLAAESFFPSQFDMIDGPIAVAFVGYIGEQIVSYGDTDLSIGSLVGATASFSPMDDDGISIVMAIMPESSNITGISPDVEGLTMHDNESNMVMWNASGLGVVSDYIIEFESDDFPPDIVIARTFSPGSTVPGGSVEVTVTVTNNGTIPIENIVIVDNGVEAIYSTIAIAGDMTGTIASLAGGASTSITYTVTFVNEGKYTFPNAELTYEFNAQEYNKDTATDGYDVAADPVQLLSQMVLDGMPISGAILGIVALGALFNINKMRKGGGSGGGYQV